MQIIELTKAADLEAVRKFSGNEVVDIGVTFKTVPLPEPVDILVGEVEKVVNPRSGKAMTAMVENKVTRIKMEDFGMYVATRSVKAPRAYLFAYDEKSSRTLGRSTLFQRGYRTRRRRTFSEDYRRPRG